MSILDAIKSKLRGDKPSYNVIIGKPLGKVYDPHFIGPRERGGINSSSAIGKVVTSDPNYPTSRKHTGGGGSSS